MSGHKQICACGHDVDTHYRDPRTKQRLACTGLYCDCRHYTTHMQRDTPVLPRINWAQPASRNKPHADPDCQCPHCTDWYLDRLRYSDVPF